MGTSTRATASKNKPVAARRKGASKQTAPLHIHKYLARAGFASLRKSEATVRAGKVKVNGNIITEPATKVLPGKDTVLVQGKTVTWQTEPTVVYALNKPPGYVVSRKPQNGRSVFRLLPKEHKRLVAVGRLDRDSEGLLLLTNDGQLAHRLAHPSYTHKKEYLVTVVGKVGKQQLAKLRKGVQSRGELLTIDRVTIIKTFGRLTTLHCVLHAGKNRHLRRMCAGVGLPVWRLQRIKEAAIELGNLVLGKWRKENPPRI